jgi:hypothetical protein
MSICNKIIKMKKENKNMQETKEDEESCCPDSDDCSIDCNPKQKKKEFKCSCGGCCG